VDQLAEQRFWSKVDTSAGPCGCWPWTAARARGYGRFFWDGKVRQAHQGLVRPPQGCQPGRELFA
jgi:hypothetical protein